MSNYEKFKQDALKRFLTYDQEPLIRRLGLDADETYIYVYYLRRQYRIHRHQPVMEKQIQDADFGRKEEDWIEANPNETLTICDLLCHTEKPLELSESFVTLQSLNRVKGGNTQTTLAGGMFLKAEIFFDGKAEKLRSACEALGGEPKGKGDVAYEIPLYGPIHVRFSFYESDEEFTAKITMLYPANICDYLHYETLYYAVGNVVDCLTELCS